MAKQSWHHRDLDAWRVSMELTVAVYALTRLFPTSERFGLISQMRRAAVSIPWNIAEGAARGTSPEFARFLLIARGSVAELETQIELVKRLGLAEVDGAIVDNLNAIRKMLTGLIRKLSSQR